jgi:RNA polymerase sigma-70 factor (ECF subfamily)
MFRPRNEQAGSVPPQGITTFRAGAASTGASMRALALATPVSGAGEAVPGPDAERRAEERALVGRAQNGDLRAFEVLYRQHVRRVFGLCWRLASDDAGAEELVQETFVRAWSNLASYRGEAPFASWLYRLALNLALNERRSRRRAPFLTLAPDELGNVAGPTTRTSGPDLGVDLERALRALPPRARAVIVLHDIEGHKHEDIASLMGMEPGTSKSQLHRARRLLREALST